LEESLGAKEKILETVVLLLKEKKDISRITNRQIASLANVNSALINYYFQSKENLINTAVGVCMGNVFEEIIEKAKNDVDPIERLKNMIKVISEVSYTNYDLIKITIASEMKDGGLTTNKLIFPLLREIFGDSKTELQLKLIASQILIPLQTIFLNADAYKNYLKNDVFDNETRNKIIDIMIGNLLNIL
jgi:AcrR family transcriptional regulator